MPLFMELNIYHFTDRTLYVRTYNPKKIVLFFLFLLNFISISVFFTTNAELKKEDIQLMQEVLEKFNS